MCTQSCLHKLQILGIATNWTTDEGRIRKLLVETMSWTMKKEIVRHPIYVFLLKFNDRVDE